MHIYVIIMLSSRLPLIMANLTNRWYFILQATTSTPRLFSSLQSLVMQWCVEAVDWK